MVITKKVKSQYFVNKEQVIRLAPSNPQLAAATSESNRNAWTVDEHNRFLEALERYPSGPWKTIALFVGSRSTRQTMAHAQKYRERIARQRQALAEGSNSDLSLPHNASAAAAESIQVPDFTKADFHAEIANDLALHFDVEELERDLDDQLLLVLCESCKETPFSGEEAQWIAEHYDSISLAPHSTGV